MKIVTQPSCCENSNTALCLQGGGGRTALMLRKTTERNQRWYISTLKHSDCEKPHKTLGCGKPQSTRVARKKITQLSLREVHTALCWGCERKPQSTEVCQSRGLPKSRAQPSGCENDSERHVKERIRRRKPSQRGPSISGQTWRYAITGEPW